MASIQENYENLQSAIDIRNFEGTRATDLKLANNITGLISHSSAHTYTYYVAKSGELSENAECRTIGKILENHSNWLEGGGAAKTAKEYMNCVCTPIVSANSDELILD